MDIGSSEGCALGEDAEFGAGDFNGEPDEAAVGGCPDAVTTEDFRGLFESGTDLGRVFDDGAGVVDTAEYDLLVIGQRAEKFWWQSAACTFESELLRPARSEVGEDRYQPVDGRSVPNR